ncbi:MAG: BspA family leucine-rich repeat surface protein [Clostridia bacterium]|nr:BspA family leucine-rich repeat surface protein [Clostridia bacterium]
MVTFELGVVKQRLRDTEKVLLAADANDTISFRFHFDRNWRLFGTKAAIFRNTLGEFYIVEIRDDRVTVPWEVLTHDGVIELSVVAFDGEDVLTTECEELRVGRSLLPDEYKLLSPSETLFDRFRLESRAQAYQDYRDEINSLKASYEEIIAELEQTAAASEGEHQAALAQKNAEIAELEYRHSVDLNALNTRIIELGAQLDAANEDAEKWGLVNTALGKATGSNQPLWGFSAGEYRLPDLNTVGLTALTSTSISSDLKEVGFDVSSITSLEWLYLNKNGIEKLRLKNAGGVTSYSSTFEGCQTIREFSLDSASGCTSMRHMFTNAQSLERVTLADVSNVENFDGMFYNCIVLSRVDGVLDLSSATSVNGIFSGCYSLESIRFERDSIGVSLDMSHCISLNASSIRSIARGLQPAAGGTLRLSRYAFERAYATEEDRDEIYDIVVNEKEWVFSLS